MRTDRKFMVNDENLLFKSMGLTKTTPEEIKKLFKPKLYNFLCQNENLITKPKED